MSTFTVKVSQSIDWSGEITIEADCYQNDDNNNLVFVDAEGYVIKTIHADLWFEVC